MILLYLFIVLSFIGIIPSNKNENKAFTSITYSCKTKEGEYFGDDIENIPDNFIIKKIIPMIFFQMGINAILLFIVKNFNSKVIVMTKEEAIRRIQDHMIIHKSHESRAIYITEALEMAIKALKESEKKEI